MARSRSAVSSLAVKSYGIFSPILGIREDMPSILLKEAYIPEGQDVIFQNGEIHRAKKRLKEFSYQFPHKILGLYEYKKNTTGEKWLIILTKRDILYRDANNDRFVFLNKLYTTGTVSVTNGSATVTGSGTTWTSEVKAGDYFCIGSGTPHSDLTWYEIQSVDSDTQLTLTTAYQGETASGQAYIIRKTFTGGDYDYWSCITFNDKFLATNGVDNIIVWTGSGQVSDLTMTPNTYKAKYLYSFENRVILGYTIESGNNYPLRVRWSGLGDETNWNEVGSDSGAMTVEEGEGVITGFASIQGFLIIFKEKAIIKAWNVATSEVFNKKIAIDGWGCYAPKSIIQIPNGVFFYSQDNTFRFFNGLSLTEISRPLYNTVRNLNPEYEIYIQGTYDEYYNQILWAVPDATSTGRNNKVLVYDLDIQSNNWGILDLEVSCFGSYLLEEQYTWDTLRYSSWDTWAWDRWDERLGISDAPYSLMAGYDNYIYRLYGDELDNGSTYEGYFVLATDLENKRGLNIYKRLLKMQVYARPESSSTLNVYVKRDDDATWQSAGSVSLSGDGEFVIKELPVDYLSRNFKIKFSGNNRFRFLGVVFYFIEVGDR